MNSLLHLKSHNQTKITELSKNIVNGDQYSKRVHSMTMTGLNPGVAKLFQGAIMAIKYQHFLNISK